ncbi:MAG: transglutaminase family protein [Proteobacteria bacterium]|nr:transglutaminase family protein [Pseudomonadota bacterium]
MQLEVACDIELELETQTTLILMLQPQSGDQQEIVDESFHLSQAVRAAEYTDLYGNRCQRTIVDPGRLSIMTRATVLTADTMDQNYMAGFTTVDQLPENVLTFLTPSRYCESDRLGEVAADLTAGASQGYPQVAKIVDWIRDTLPYTPGTSDLPLSAREVMNQRHGVCRDLTHLAIALCRSISIPARMVVGYLDGLRPMDMHAWFEAFVGDRWYAFDPSQWQLMGGRVTLAYGRDAADVALYHVFGPLPIWSSLRVSVQRR